VRLAAARILRIVETERFIKAIPDEIWSGALKVAAAICTNRTLLRNGGGTGFHNCVRANAWLRTAYRAGTLIPQTIPRNNIAGGKNAHFLGGGSGRNTCVRRCER
jgi:hypothetical protein